VAKVLNDSPRINDTSCQGEMIQFKGGTIQIASLGAQPQLAKFFIYRRKIFISAKCSCTKR